MKKILYLSILLTGIAAGAQSYSWQWAKAGGGVTGSSGVGFSDLTDEMIRDVVVDAQNNSYFLTKIWPQNPNFDGTPVTSYQHSDLLLVSLDCGGNLRWTRTIGGYGDSEFAWNLKVDNSGGLYMMINVSNQAHVQSPTTLPIRWDDTHAMPVTTVAYTDNTTIDPGLNTAFLLKYNTAGGTLAWQKPLENALGVSRSTIGCLNGVWTMDSDKNIHAVIGFKAGTHLDGLITVPASFTTDLQYYIVKFNFAGGDMVPQPNPILLDISGRLASGVSGGKIQLLYDETLNRYYIGGSTSADFQQYIPLSFWGVPVSDDGFLIAFSGADGSQVWRKEFSTYVNGPTTSPDEKIFSLIKDTDGSLYLSGRYYHADSSPLPTLGTYELPFIHYGQHNFVMKMNPAGNVIWTKVPTLPATNFVGTRSMRARIAMNGNEVALVKGTRGNEVWDGFTINNTPNDLANSLLVRLNKDTGAAIGLHKISSTFGSDDELTAIAVDNDGNYVLGGYFHTEIFTDPNDNIPTISFGASNKSQFYVAKFAKTACSTVSTAEVADTKPNVTLYPNPAEDVLHFETEDAAESFEIIAMSGQKVMAGQFKSGEQSINIARLTTGTYMVKIKTKTGEATGKVIKK